MDWYGLSGISKHDEEWSPMQICKAFDDNDDCFQKYVNLLWWSVLTHLLAQGKNMPRVNTPSKGPPIMPNNERAACKIQLIIYSIFKTFDINSCGVDMFLISSRVVLCTSHKIMCSFDMLLKTSYAVLMCFWYHYVWCWCVSHSIMCGVDVFQSVMCGVDVSHNIMCGVNVFLITSCVMLKFLKASYVVLMCFSYHHVWFWCLSDSICCGANNVEGDDYSHA